jgi:thiol-disulfide isomerase/thioredoxin
MYRNFSDLGEQPERNINQYNVVEIQNQEHKQSVLRNNLIVCVNHHSNWCEVCKKTAHIYAGIAEKHSKRGLCAVVNEDFDKNLTYPRPTGLPTYQFFYRGNKIGEDIIGADLEKVDKFLEDYINRFGGNPIGNSRDPTGNSRDPIGNNDHTERNGQRQQEMFNGRNLERQGPFQIPLNQVTQNQLPQGQLPQGQINRPQVSPPLNNEQISYHSKSSIKNFKTPSQISQEQYQLSQNQPSQNQSSYEFETPNKGNSMGARNSNYATF